MQETPKASAAFEAYCVLGSDRTLKTLAEQLVKNSLKARGYARVLQKWSKLYEWQERVKVYDREHIQQEATARRKARQQAYEADLTVQLESAIALKQLALKQVQALIGAERFGSQASVQLLKLAADEERSIKVALQELDNQPHTQETGAIDLSTEELLRIVSVVQKEMLYGSR